MLIDARMVGPVGHGVARYLELIVEGLAEMQAERPLAYEPVFITQGGFRFPGFASVGCATPFLSPTELWELPRLLKRERAALYHSPSFASLIQAPCPWIVTVHDLIHLTYGSPVDKVYYRVLLKPFIRRAALPLSISEFSRRQISEWANVPESGIDLVPNAITAPQVDEARVNEVLSRFGLERGKFFVTLSNPKPHKNIPLLIDAYAAFRAQMGERAWPLVITAPGLREVPGVRLVRGLGNEDAQALLKGAGALFFPSLEEGFGRPPLEAAILGVPVVVSRIPSHEEAMVDFRPHEALWVDPRDFHGWTSAFHRVQRGEVPPAAPETRAAVLTRYTPRHAAQLMDRAYRRVLGLRA